MHPSVPQRVPCWRGLTFKQALATLLIAMCLGILVGAGELILDWRELRAETQRHFQQTLTLVEGSAAEAAYQMHPDLAHQLVDGLFVFEAVAFAELRDNFDNRLAKRGRPPASPKPSALVQRLFSDITNYRQPLHYPTGSGEPTPVGELRIELAPAVLAERFLAQASRDGLFGLARAILIAALVVLIFSVWITRPLVRLSNAIARVEPTQPGNWQPPALPHHRRDELGLLLANFDHLRQAFQTGLDQRDEAEQALKALTAELEQRVQTRTQELQHALEEIQQQHDELEQANHSLAKANQQVMESIRYARRIQRAMLPDKQALDYTVQEIAVCWEPLHVVGGDWFWLESFAEAQLVFIADCTGHGVPGAFITLVVASAMDRILHERQLRQPNDILLALDDEVRTRLRQDHPDTEADDGLEAAVLVWYPQQCLLQYAGAGVPLLCIDSTGQASTIRGTRAHLGYSSLPAPTEFTEHQLEVTPGTAYYLFTDGITDHVGGQPKRLMGRRRLTELLSQYADRPLAEQVAHIEAALADYRGDEPRRDDMTLIAIRPI